jgi:TRAP-type C4-dicarboxylate transport system permease small subunit
VLISQLGKFIVGLARLGVGIAFSVLIGSVIIQVLGRINGSSPVWTEELTRYSLLYMIAFGACLAFRSGDLVNVDVICEALPDPFPKILRVCAAIMTFILSVYLLPHAWKYVAIGKLQTSPALELRMDAVHFSVWLTLLGLAVFSLLRIVQVFFLSDSGKPLTSYHED